MDINGKFDKFMTSNNYIIGLAIRLKDWMMTTLSWPCNVIGGAHKMSGNGEEATAEVDE